MVSAATPSYLRYRKTSILELLRSSGETVAVQPNSVLTKLLVLVRFTKFGEINIFKGTDSEGDVACRDCRGRGKRDDFLGRIRGIHNLAREVSVAVVDLVGGPTSSASSPEHTTNISRAASSAESTGLVLS